MAQRGKSQLHLFEGGKRRRGGDDEPPEPPAIMDASLSDETQRRYLNYALSVITARALPDVRDGLKPVQRRILFTMHNDLRLRSDAKARKSAAIVGDVMGKYHPHGDVALYEALVRLAQDFTMRVPLVDGRGNFGSADGDSAAAMRYTEARLRPIAEELLAELGKRTVAHRPNYDGTRFEPVVLPARFPHLLVNGSQGIAVGMATSIPPHNLSEVIDAAVAMIDEPDIGVKGLMKHIKGPDFPTGGQLLNTRREIAEVYGTGQGSLRLRGEWQTEQNKRGNPYIIITAVPYAVERSTVVEKIAQVIIGRKLPPLVDVRDESTDETRVVLEIKKGTDPQLVMAYLYKHTPLQTTVQVNLTGLVPTDNPEIASPARLDLQQLLRHFLDFRMEVVHKRLQYDLEQLERRIHILEGLEIIFDALDETIRIIRRSEGKKDAAAKLIKRFELDEEQVDAILELRLYRLAQLEILLIREELQDKRKEAKRIGQLLNSPAARWKLIRAELLELKTRYAERRRTRVVANVDEPEYDAEAFIIEEDAHVVLTQQGWVKRLRELKDASTTRVREGDRVLDVAAGSTKSVVAMFSNFGSCYVCRVNDVPATTGYGVPVQKLFKLDDGERIIRMLGFDPRVLEVPPATDSGEPEPPYAVAVTRGGMTLAMSLRAHAEPSTRSGRRYMRLKDGDEVIYVGHRTEGAQLACATNKGRALICDAEEVSLLAGPGKGVMLIRLEGDDEVIGARLLSAPSDALVVLKESGTRLNVSTRKYNVVSRAGKGHALFKRGKLVGVELPAPTVPELGSDE